MVLKRLIALLLTAAHMYNTTITCVALTTVTLLCFTVLACTAPHCAVELRRVIGTDTAIECADKVSSSSTRTADVDCKNDAGAVCNKAGKCAILRPGTCVTSDHCKFSPQGNICSADGHCTKAGTAARKHRKHQLVQAAAAAATEQAAPPNSC
jgi:hypothetical protein